MNNTERNDASLSLPFFTSKYWSRQSCYTRNVTWSFSLCNIRRPISASLVCVFSRPAQRVSLFCGNFPLCIVALCVCAISAITLGGGGRVICTVTTIHSPQSKPNKWNRTIFSRNLILNIIFPEYFVKRQFQRLGLPRKAVLTHWRSNEQFHPVQKTILPSRCFRFFRFHYRQHEYWEWNIGS